MRHLHAHGGGGCTCFIIPPHMLEQIALNGTPDQREKAATRWHSTYVSGATCGPAAKSRRR